MTRLLFLAFLGGCNDTQPPHMRDCVEFSHASMRDGRAVVCRMVWCGNNTWSDGPGGPATLWCDGSKDGAAE